MVQKGCDFSPIFLEVLSENFVENFKISTCWTFGGKAPRSSTLWKTVENSMEPDFLKIYIN